MTDLQVALIILACTRLLHRPAGPVRPGPAMNVLDVLAALGTVFLFVYLLWALLRPEDF